MILPHLKLIKLIETSTIKDDILHIECCFLAMSSLWNQTIVVMKLLNKENEDLREVSNVVRDIEFLLDSFIYVSYFFCKRSSNALQPRFNCTASGCEHFFSRKFLSFWGIPNSFKLLYFQCGSPPSLLRTLKLFFVLF